MARGWDAQTTLVYAPRKRPGYELDLCVVGRMFAWDDRSPIVWLFSTIGLCKVAQPAQPGRPAFRRFELVLATNNAELEDPFPSRLGVVLSANGGDFPGWDWKQVEPPPLMDWLVIAGEEVGTLLRRGSHFALTDRLTLGPGGSTWTRSRLDHSVLLPVTPHMIVSGFVPFNAAGDPEDTVHPSEWHRKPGTEQFEYGFCWLLPVTPSEYAKASADGAWNVFADLVERSAPDARDDFAVAFDWLRR